MKFIIWFVVIGALAVVRVLRYRRRRSEQDTTTPVAHGPSAARQAVESAFGDVGLVAARELRERTRGRIYRIGTLLILAVVAAAIVIPRLNKSSNPSVEVAVVGTVTPAIRSTVSQSAKEIPASFQLRAVGSLAAGKRLLRSGSTDAVIDRQGVYVEQAVSASDSSTDAQLAQNLSSRLSVLDTLQAANLSPAQTAQLEHPVSVRIVGLTPAHHKGAVQGTTIIGLVLLFVLLSQYSAWILMGVAEEKSSRVVEVLLATVRPINLLAGKVLGIGAAALTQATVVIVFALVLAKAVGSDILSGTEPVALAASLLWLVLGYAFYCWVYAAAGSMTERTSQLQSVSFPLSVPMLIGYIVSITAASSGNASEFFKVLAYLPPTAPFAMPVLVGLGDATWWEFVLAALLSILGTFGTAHLAARIYQRAILRTGRRVRLREVIGTA